MNATSTVVPVTPSDSGDAVFGVGGVVIGLAVICVALRFYTRIFTKAGLWWDDWMVLVAVVATLMTAALLLWSNSIDPNGQWVSDNADPDYIYTLEDQYYLKLSFITSVLYFTIAASTKLGILLMYNRIFAVRGSFRYQILLLCLLVTCYWIGCTVATLTNCIPLEWSWINGLADERYCFNYNIFWMATGACEVALDVAILALPVRAVFSLQLTLRRRITVLSIFLLGAFVVITGLVKTVLGYVPGGRVPSYSRTEVWTTVHTGIAIVCACLPIFKPLLHRISHSRLGRSVSKTASKVASRIASSPRSTQARDPESLIVGREWTQASRGTNAVSSVAMTEDGRAMGLPSTFTIFGRREAEAVDPAVRTVMMLKGGEREKGVSGSVRVEERGDGTGGRS